MTSDLVQQNGELYWISWAGKSLEGACHQLCNVNRNVLLAIHFCTVLEATTV